MIGRRIAHYEILEKLGAGGMGVVYKARDTRLDRPVAIKFLSFHLGGDREARERFLREARAASAIDHPNVCAVHAIDETPEGDVYMVMAYYEGTPLDQLLNRGPLPVTRAVEIAAQVAAGLARAHDKGIAHRDIKPSNLILTPDGTVKILDFGLAKIASAEAFTVGGLAFGTPAYMSPEQAEGRPSDRRADVWALGVLLYAMLAGAPPFAGDTARSVLSRVLTSEPRPLAELGIEVPSSLKAILDRCLEKDPGRRYPDAGAVLADLRGVLAETGAGSRSDSVPGAFLTSTPTTQIGGSTIVARGSRWGNRRLAWGTTVLLVAAALVWGGLRIVHRGPGPALRIAVPLPVVTADPPDPDTTAVAQSVRLALTRGLLALRNVVPVDPSSFRDPGRTPVEIARTVGAAEVLSARVAGTAREWRVVLTRVDGRTGGDIWGRDFTVPKDASPLQLPNVVMAQLRGGYAKLKPKPGATALDVRSEDYHEFLHLQASFHSTGGSGEDPAVLLDEVAALEKTSPDFLEAYLLEAEIARYLYDLNKAPELLDRGAEAAKQAARLSPLDPRPVADLFDFALRTSDLDGAKRELDALERIDPGNPEILLKRSALAEREGHPDRALALMRQATAHAPYRGYYEAQADLEYRLGRVDAARADLERVVSMAPGYLFAESKLAQIELLYGDPKRAETLYADLVKRSPGNSARHTNLGLARELLGDYEAAADEFRAALELAPRDPTVMLNLADSQAILHRDRAADSLYARVLERIAQDPDSTSADNLLVRAQCLAHLGRSEQAVAAVRDALRSAADDSEALYIASLVYAVVGDRASALVNARDAIGKGVQARWFGLPFFDSIRSDPGFQALLGTGPAAGS
jgi:tetratricopeptide (TPR) repeat protein/tRNA A-37 threonylcarbamoyl transferase component Bud32